MPIVEYHGEVLPHPPGASAGTTAFQPPSRRITPYEGPVIQPPQPQARRSRTFTEELARQLGLTARAGVEGVTGAAGVMGDALNSMVNLALPKDRQLQMPSQMVQRGLQAAGLPEPETPTEHVVNFLGGAVAGGGDPILRGAQKAINRSAPPQAFTAPGRPAADTSLDLHQAGVSLPPSRMEGSGPARALEGIAGKSQVAQTLAEKNQPLFQQLARRELNLPEGTPLTKEMLDRVSAKWGQEGYEPLKNFDQPLTIGKIFRDKVAGVLQKYSGSHSFDDLQTKRRLGQQLNPVEDAAYNVLFNANGRYKQSYTAQDMIDMSRILRANASDNFKNNNTTIAKAQKELANILEDNIETSLARAPGRAVVPYGTITPAPSGRELLTNFRKARQQIAKTHAVEEMLVDPHTGIIDPAKAHALEQAGHKLTGGLQTIAKAGSPLYGQSTRAPIQGSSLPVELGTNMGLGAGAGGAAYMLSQDPEYAGLAMGVGALGRTGARKLLSSPWYQQRLANNLMAGGGFSRTPAGQRAMASLPLGLMPLFTQGQQ